MVIFSTIFGFFSTIFGLSIRSTASHLINDEVKLQTNVGVLKRQEKLLQYIINFNKVHHAWVHRKADMLGKFDDFFVYFFNVNEFILSWQVIAFICGNIVIVLLIMALTSTDWLLSSGWRQGLFTHCIEDLSQPIPFNYEAKEEGCYPSRDVCA